MEQPFLASALQEAQNQARKWADRALELNEAGEVERAGLAQAQAEIWLTRMRDIEKRRKTSSQIRRTASIDVTSVAPCAGWRGADLTSAADQSTHVNSVTLRAWKRAIG